MDVYKKIFSMANRAAKFVLEKCIPQYNHRKVPDFIVQPEKIKAAEHEGVFTFHGD